MILIKQELNCGEVELTYDDDSIFLISRDGISYHDSKEHLTMCLNNEIDFSTCFEYKAKALVYKNTILKSNLNDEIKKYCIELFDFWDLNIIHFEIPTMGKSFYDSLDKIQINKQTKINELNEKCNTRQCRRKKERELLKKCKI